MDVLNLNSKIKNNFTYLYEKQILIEDGLSDYIKLSIFNGIIDTKVFFIDFD